MTRIFVTGAAGFIGSHVTDALLARGDTVLGFDNFDAFYDPAIKRANLRGACEHDRFTLVEDDLRNRAGLMDAVREFQPERVLHLAAMAGVRPSIQRPHVYQEVNVGGTLNLLDAMVEAGSVKKFVFGSTSSVYGADSTPPFKESEAADRPVSPYAATKRGAEHLCYTYHHIHHLPTTVLRFFTVYGPRQRPEMAIHRFCRLILSGETIPMFGDGTTTRDYTYVKDILDGVLKAIDLDQEWGVYNLGESRRLELKSLITMLGEALGVEPRIEQLDLQPGDVPTTYADISAAKRDFGYDPSYPVERGIAEFVTWLREQDA